MGSRSHAKVMMAVFPAALVLGGVLSVCIVFGPAWIVGRESDLRPVDRLTAEVDGAGSELGRIDLRDAELDGLDIPHVCFAHSNLDGARLTGAKLAGATLSDTLLRKTDLSGADLCGADLTRADLDGAILLGADLTDAKLSDVSLSGVIADNTTTTTWPHGFTPLQPGA